MSGLILLPENSKRVPKTINNAFSAGGTRIGTASGASTFANNYGALGIKTTPSLTAATPYTLLTVSGPGEIEFFGGWNNAATAKTITLKVTIDGIDVFNATSSSIGAQFDGFMAIGNCFLGFTSAAVPNYSKETPISFNHSLVLTVTSSTTVSNIDFIYSYKTF